MSHRQEQILQQTYGKSRYILYFLLFKRIKCNAGKANTRTQTTQLHTNLEINDPSSQTETFAEYYEQLDVPDNNRSFNDEYLDVCTFRCSL